MEDSGQLKPKCNTAECGMCLKSYKFIKQWNALPRQFKINYKNTFKRTLEKHLDNVTVGNMAEQRELSTVITHYLLVSLTMLIQVL